MSTGTTTDEQTRPPVDRPRPARRSANPGPRPTGWERFLGEPRSAVLLVLGSVVLVGGGLRLYRAWQARRAVARLEGDDVAPEAIAASVSHGRAGLFDLFRLLGEAKAESSREAAGHAISVLWAKDELIAEEEKALVRRGFRVDWKARKRYPRALSAEIPVVVTYGLPCLKREGGGVAPDKLEWSHRVVGARRANLEAFSPWTKTAGRAEFAIVPADFDTDGPHRLVLQARARTVGLTESWERELPHMPFSFEFDPRLTPAALLSLPESTRVEAVARRIAMVAPLNAEPPAFQPLNASLALRNPPELRVETPLPCDLAHVFEVELEGLSERFGAGRVVLAGQGEHGKSAAGFRTFPIGSSLTLPENAIDRPGSRRLRAILSPDPEIAWGDPDVRSLWPEPIVSEWIDVEIVRR